MSATANIFHNFFSIFIVDFEHKNVYYVMNISAKIQNPNKLRTSESELALSHGIIFGIIHVRKMEGILKLQKDF